MMRTCRGCDTAKPSEEFYSTPGGRCKPCIKVQRRARYASTKGRRVNAWLSKLYATIPCMDCERVFPYCAMDFDHRPEEIKSFVIGRLGTAIASPERKKKILEEIRKCDYVCACCHRIRTVARFEVSNAKL